MLEKYLFFIVVGFASGSVLFGFLLPKWLKGVDVVAASDDHNPGTANAVKHAGWPLGSLCLICDLAKGFIPVWFAASRTDRAGLLFALAVAAPVAGHAFSPLLRGRGGKALAVSFGVLLGLLPYSRILFFLVGLFVFFSVAVVIRPHRVRVMLVYLLLAVSGVLFAESTEIAVAVLLICAIVELRHIHIRSAEKYECRVLGKTFVWPGFGI